MEKKINHYTIVRLLGTGGMGQVFEAVHDQMGRRAAIKVLHKKFAHNKQIAARFLNEARATSMVQSPSLVQIYEYGQTADGTAFLVMEYLDGGTLRQKLEAFGGRFPAERAMRLCRQMASGLQAAHQKGVIHRDLKPVNVSAERGRPANDPQRCELRADPGLGCGSTGDRLGTETLRGGADLLPIAGVARVHFPAMDLKDKAALVTGGSAGIGLAVARQLVARGCRVALVARTRQSLDRAVAELGGERAIAFAVDVTDRAAVAALPAQVAQQLGGLDILINNAGYNCRGAVQDRKAEELVQILETNLTAPVFLTRVALDQMRPGGVIVNIASIAGKIPVPHEAAYSASKFGLRAFSRALAEDLRPRGIRVSCVCPGPVDTEFFGDLATVPDLVFSQPMSSAEQVAAVIMRCVHADPAPLEPDIPAVSGALAQAGYLFPALASLLRPSLEKKGARAKAEYTRRKSSRSAP